MIAFCLVIPEGLGALSLKAGFRGWLKGYGITKELLAVALSSHVAEGDPIYAPASVRLFNHWAIVHSKSFEQLIPWIAVKPGFGRALTTRQIRDRSDLTMWIQDGLSLDLPSDEFAALCCLEPGDGKVVEHLVIVTQDDRVFRGEVYVVSAEPCVPARFDGLRPIETLQEKRVAVIGVGSGGSMAALHLAAAGVGTLHLFDRDRLTPANLFRHACDLRHLGRAKVLAMRDLIRSYDLPARVVPHEQDVVKNAGDLWEIMGEVDLVLCATDNALSRRLVNYVCVHTATPLVMACTFHNARIGEIIRVLPGQSACYECTRLALHDACALEPVEEGDAPAVAYGPAHEHTSGSASQGTRVDVAMVAALQARVAIMTLLADAQEGSSLPCDYMAWGVMAQEGFPEPFTFPYPFSLNWVQLERRDDCPVCSSLGIPPGLEIDAAYKAIMARLQEVAKS